MAGRIPLALPVGTVIDILVQTRRGFVIYWRNVAWVATGDPIYRKTGSSPTAPRKGPAERSLTMSDATETLPVQFKLCAKELGVGQIRVLAFHSGIALGTLTLVPTGCKPKSGSNPW
jgi:hypothetical protein